MKSVMSIEKITKAMKMVAAAKMKGELARLESGKDFGYNSVDMIFKSDLYLQRKAPIQEIPNASELLVPLSSDKGLCGSINSSIVREIKSYLKEKGTNNVKIVPPKRPNGQIIQKLSRPQPSGSTHPRASDQSLR